MRKLGIALAFVGGFLVMVGVLATWYAPGQLMKTPLNVDTITHLAGTATLNGATSPIKITSTTLANSDKSDGSVVVFATSSCVVKDVGNPPQCVAVDDPQHRLITASVDNFATDRKTALAVNDPKYLPADATAHHGLVNKFPFQTAKQTYPFWDGTANATEQATFAGTQVLDGLEVDNFRVVVDKAPIQLAPGVKGLYSDQKTLGIDPVTGSIVNQVEHQTRVTTDGKPVIDLTFRFTPQQVATSVSDAKSNGSKLHLVSSTMPLVGFLLGIPCLLLGLALVGLNRKGAAGATA